MKQVPVTFPCQDISLEGVWHFPESAGLSPAVVVCHPHPLYGGDMSNNVVLAICQALVEKSIAALRFNFRGVGGSGGGFGGDIAEQEDVRAAIDLALSTPDVDAERIGLAGYSFGATVILPVAPADVRVKGAATISLPLDPPGLEPWREYLQPKLLISGGCDESVPASEFERLASELPDPKEYIIVPDADHFWWLHEAEAASRVADFFARLAETG